jgi:hypothetical protein
VAGGFLPDM